MGPIRVEDTQARRKPLGDQILTDPAPAQRAVFELGLRHKRAAPALAYEITLGNQFGQCLTHRRPAELMANLKLLFTRHQVTRLPGVGGDFFQEQSLELEIQRHRGLAIHTCHIVMTL